MFKNCLICHCKVFIQNFKYKSNINFFQHVNNSRNFVTLGSASYISYTPGCFSSNKNFIFGKNTLPAIFSASQKFSSTPFNSKDSKHVNELSETDKVKRSCEPIIGEGTWEEVYKGVLTTKLKLLKMFSISTSVIALSVQPILYEKLGSTNLGIIITMASFLGVFTFVTPALIHWVSKAYVTKLEYDPKREIYAATTLSFFLREKKIYFKLDDVFRPELPGPFTSFKVNNKAYFIEPDMFEDVQHYIRIMGLDKPFDFRDDESDKSNKE